MENEYSKIEIGTVIQLELKTKSPIIFGRFGGGSVEHGLTYTGKLTERRWSKTKNDYKLKFINSDGSSTYFFEGSINRQYNILGRFFNELKELKMKTKEEILKETGIQWDRLNKELPLLASKVLRAMEMYNTEQLKNLDLHIASNSLLPCGFEKCLVDIEGEKMCSFCKYNNNHC